MPNPVCPVCELPHPEGSDARMCVNALQSKLRALLKAVGDEGVCSACLAPIIWVVHRNGKRAPYTLAGLNHFADCPAAERFRKGSDV